MKNIRFWTWLNGGLVKLTLKPDERIVHYHRAPTEEGFHGEGHEFFYDAGGERLLNMMLTEGRDCDGYTSYSSIWECSFDQLKARPCECDGSVFIPNWKRIKASVYDQFAAMSGY
jgi:hypothetical protein